MIITLVIRSNHLDNSYSALKFANAVLEKQHTINCLYFMFDGVYLANKNLDMPTDEYNLSQQWSEFAHKHNLELIVCAASSLRRGINSASLAPTFKLGGIGQLVEAIDNADRVLSL